MNDEYKIRNNALVTPTTFTKDGHHLSAKELLSYNDEVLKKELKKIVPIIQEKADRIRKLFNEIPEEYKGIPICSKVRKDFYIKGMEIRFHERIYPAYEKIVEKQYEDYRTGDLE